MLLLSKYLLWARSVICHEVDDISCGGWGGLAGSGDRAGGLLLVAGPREV